MARSRSTSFLIALLGSSGVLHFVRPGPFVAIVPRKLPAKRALVYLSGGAELVCAALLARPASRESGGLAAAVLLVAVFPANLSMALQAKGRPAWYQLGCWARLPLQIPLVVWALRSK